MVASSLAAVAAVAHEVAAAVAAWRVTDQVTALASGQRRFSFRLPWTVVHGKAVRLLHEAQAHNL